MWMSWPGLCYHYCLLSLLSSSTIILLLVETEPGIKAISMLRPGLVVFTPSVIKIMSWLNLFLRKETILLCCCMSSSANCGLKQLKYEIWTNVLSGECNLYLFCLETSWIWQGEADSWNIRGGALLSKVSLFVCLSNLLGIQARDVIFVYHYFFLFVFWIW